MLPSTSPTVASNLRAERMGTPVAVNGSHLLSEENELNKDELAINIAQVVLTATIDRMTDYDRLQKIADRLPIWAAEGGIQRFKQDVAERRVGELDAFELRIRAALSFISEMQAEGRVENDMCKRFLAEILGALDGFDAR